MSEESCEHDLEFIGDQKAERGVNKYFRCRKCGDVFVHSEEENRTYRIPGVKS